MNTLKLEDRVAALETEVARLKQKIEGNSKSWTDEIVGAFANDPAFEEAMRLGRAYRESLRPKPKKSQKQ